jgi:hypothetical protein
MIYYAHRGNVSGPVPLAENTPDHIQRSLDLGFHAEVDVRALKGRFFLGHDSPDYPVTETWIDSRASRLLLHAKELEAANLIQSVGARWTYFVHKSDPFALISNGDIWVHDLNQIWFHLEAPRFIVPLLTRQLTESFKDHHFKGICSDYLA